MNSDSTYIRTRLRVAWMGAPDQQIFNPCEKSAVLPDCGNQDGGKCQTTADRGVAEDQEADSQCMETWFRESLLWSGYIAATRRVVSRLMQRCMDRKLDQHHAREVHLVNALHSLVKPPDVSRGTSDHWFDCCNATWDFFLLLMAPGPDGQRSCLERCAVGCGSGRQPSKLGGTHPKNLESCSWKWEECAQQQFNLSYLGLRPLGPMSAWRLSSSLRSLVSRKPAVPQPYLAIATCLAGACGRANCTDVWAQPGLSSATRTKLADENRERWNGGRVLLC